jgi:hypothetical protein
MILAEKNLARMIGLSGLSFGTSTHTLDWFLWYNWVRGSARPIVPTSGVTTRRLILYSAVWQEAANTMAGLAYVEDLDLNNAFIYLAQLHLSLA